MTVNITELCYDIVEKSVQSVDFFNLINGLKRHFAKNGSKNVPNAEVKLCQKWK